MPVRLVCLTVGSAIAKARLGVWGRFLFAA
jgi:hypothetical protein